MVNLALDGRAELQPDTVSFNTMIDALSKSGQRGAQRQAEILLGQMETLANDLSFPCQPDTQSFNIVINSWTKVYIALLVRGSCRLDEPVLIVASLWRCFLVEPRTGSRSSC